MKSRMMVSRFRGTFLLLLTLLAEVSKTMVVGNRMNLGRVVGTPFERETLADRPLVYDYVSLRFFFSSHLTPRKICNKFSFFNFLQNNISLLDYSASS